MKKIITLISFSFFVFSSSFLHATQDLLELVELNKATSEAIALGEITSSNASAEATVGEYSRYCGIKLYELEMTTNVFATRITAFRNTFIWYIWNDADKVKGDIGKYGIIKDIHELTKNE